MRQQPSSRTPCQTVELTFSSSLCTHPSQRNQESVGDSDGPQIQIPCRTELPPVARHGLEPVLQVIVQTEFSFARVCARQFESFRLICADLATVELFQPSCEFDASH